MGTSSPQNLPGFPAQCLSGFPVMAVWIWYLILWSWWVLVLVSLSWLLVVASGDGCPIGLLACPLCGGLVLGLCGVCLSLASWWGCCWWLSFVVASCGLLLVAGSCGLSWLGCLVLASFVAGFGWRPFVLSFVVLFGSGSWFSGVVGLCSFSLWVFCCVVRSLCSSGSGLFCVFSWWVFWCWFLLWLFFLGFWSGLFWCCSFGLDISFFVCIDIDVFVLFVLLVWCLVVSVLVFWWCLVVVFLLVFCWFCWFWCGVLLSCFLCCIVGFFRYYWWCWGVLCVLVFISFPLSWCLILCVFLLLIWLSLLALILSGLSSAQLGGSSLGLIVLSLRVSFRWGLVFFLKIVLLASLLIGLLFCSLLPLQRLCVSLTRSCLVLVGCWIICMLILPSPTVFSP